ncbi:MAG: hypothetical protein RJA99_1005 [Pseudomonadota bacterium]|jgi:diguanylate cyclase (GGDEF)-like protein
MRGPRLPFRFTFGRKLLLGFLGTVMLSIALVWLASRTIDASERSLSTILNDEIRPLAQLNALQTQLGQMRTLELEMSRLVDLFAMTDQIERIGAAQQRFEETLERLLSARAQVAAVDAGALTDAWLRYRGDLLEARTLGLAGNTDRLAEVSAFRSAERFKTISLLLKELVDATEARAAEHLTRQADEHRRRRSAFLLTGGIGVGVLAVWFGALARDLSVRVSSLHRAAGALTDASTVEPIRLAGRDELTDLAGAFNLMQTKVSERESSLRAARSELESRVLERTRELEDALAHTRREIVERRRAEAMLEREVTHDALTGLPNRVLAGRRLVEALAAARPGGARVALFYIDLDDFKKVNDNLGHEAGDELLREASQRLVAATGVGATVARLGGDEFVVVLPEIGRADQVRAVAERIAAAFASPFRRAAGGVVVTPSIGIALSGDDAADAGTLMRRADLAMYESKAAGRNAIRFYDASIQARAARRLELEAQLRDALARDQLSLVFQPVMDSHDGTIMGAEALLRWRYGDEQSVPPDEFIPIAEHTGLIVPIGQWVIDQACGQLARWRERGASSLSIAVNVSPRQFKEPGFVRSVADALARHGLPPERLQIEVTEGLLIDQGSDVGEALRTLSALGVRLAMDDFGTGYSSLSYLKRYPFHALKIDREFVSDLDGDEESQALVAAAIRMGQALGLAVVAEGVENARQWDVLQAMRCDAVQGYHFGRPCPADEFARRWLEGATPAPPAHASGPAPAYRTLARVD